MREPDGSETGQHQKNAWKEVWGGLSFPRESTTLWAITYRTAKKMKHADGMKARLRVVYYSGMASFVFMQMDTQNMHYC